MTSTNYCSMVGKRVDMPKDCNLCPYQKGCSALMEYLHQNVEVPDRE